MSDNPYLKAIEFLQKEIEANNEAYVRYGTRGAAPHILVRLLERRDDFNAAHLQAIDVLHAAFKATQEKDVEGEQKVLDMMRSTE